MKEFVESDDGDEPYVTVIGGANIDIHGKSVKRLRQGDSNPGTVHISAGGVARNVAENLLRLGVDCRLISAIGTDRHGQVLKQLCRDAGIDLHDVHDIATVPTSTYLSVVNDTGDMQVAIAEMSIVEQLTVARLQTQQAMLARSALNIIDANLPDDTIAWLLDTFDAAPFFADTVSTSKAPRLKPFLSSIHTLKAGAAEAEALTGMKIRTPEQLQTLGAALHAAGVQRVFVTLGEQGVYYSTVDENAVEKPQRRSRAVANAGGAGDAFVAGLAYSWLQNWSLDQTVRFALAAANVTLDHASTSSPEMSVMAVNREMEARNAR